MHIDVLHMLPFSSFLDFVQVVRDHPAHHHLAFMILSIQLFRVTSLLFQLLLESSFRLLLRLILLNFLLLQLFKLLVKARLGILPLLWCLPFDYSFFIHRVLLLFSTFCLLRNEFTTCLP